MPQRQRDFASEYARRKDLARQRGLSTGQARGHPRRGEQAVSRLRAPRTGTQLAIATEPQRDFRVREVQALNALRRGEARNLTAAEREFRLPRGSLKRDLPSAFGDNGRLRGSDREAVPMNVIGPNGDELVITRGSGARRLAGQHRRAVQDFLDGRLSEQELRQRFDGKKVGGVELETDGDRLQVLYELGRVNDGPYPEQETT